LDRDKDRDAAPDLRAYVGEWVVLLNDTVIEHGPDLETIADKARARGIQRPRVVFVSPHKPGQAKLGL
jgi:Family of unknown function (DUF5678)